MMPNLSDNDFPLLVVGTYIYARAWGSSPILTAATPEIATCVAEMLNDMHSLQVRMRTEGPVLAVPVPRLSLEGGDDGQ